MSAILSACSKLVGSFVGRAPAKRSSLGTDLDALHSLSLHTDKEKYNKLWERQTSSTDSLGVDEPNAFPKCKKKPSQTRKYGGSKDVQLANQVREVYKEDEALIKRSRLSGLSMYVIIDELLKIVPPNIRKDIKKALNLAIDKGEVPDRDMTYGNNLIPVKEINDVLSDFGFQLVKPEDSKGLNGYYEMGMLVTGVAKRILEQDITDEPKGRFNTYVPHYVTTDDRKQLKDSYDVDYETCIAVREGVAEYEWSLTSDICGKTATIRFNRATGKVDTDGDSILKREYETLFVHNIEHDKATPRVYFEAVQLSDYDEQTPLLPPDIIDRDIVQDPYSKESREKSFNRILNNNTNMTGGRCYDKTAHYKEVLKAKELNKREPCIIDPPTDGTRIKIRIAHLAKDGSVANTTIMEIGRRNDKGVMKSIRDMGGGLRKCRIPNAREIEGHDGTMTTFGKSKWSRDKTYKIPTTFDINLSKVASRRVTDAWKETYPLVMESIKLSLLSAREAEVMNEEFNEDTKHTEGTNVFIFTMNLRNASHYDVNDLKYSISTWASDNPDKFKGKWFFVLPNVRVELTDETIYDGLIIVLDDSVEILWDGRVLRHCTAFCDDDELDDANAFSFFATGNGPNEEEELKAKV